MPRSSTRSFAIILLLGLLSACGGTPQTTTDAPEATPIPATVEASPATPTVVVMETAQSTPASTPTVEDMASTATAEASAGTEDGATARELPPEGQGYMALVLMQIGIQALQDTAQQVQDGTLEGMESFGALIVNGALLKATADELNKPVPVPVLAPSWDEAKEEVTAIQDVLSRWLDQEIDAAKALEELAPLDERVEATITTAEEALAAEYDLSADELAQMREERVAALEQALSEGQQADPMASATPSDDASATPEPSAPTDEGGTSRAQPLPSGATVRFNIWALTVTDVTRGEEAAAHIQAANQFNDPAPEGYEYVIASLRLENISTEQKAQSALFGVQLRVTGERNVIYGTQGVVVPQPLEGELFPGGVAEGQQAYLVPTGETNLMFVAEEGFNIEQGARFIAIDEGATLAPDPSLASIEADDAGLSPDTAVARGETVRSDDWEVTVAEVVRGADVQTRLTEANQFNKPAPEGREYVLLRAKVRWINTEEPDRSTLISTAMFRGTGDQNVVYDSPSVVAPVPPLDAQVFPGGESEGWVVVEVAAGEGKLAAVFEPLFSFGDEQTRYFSLE